MPLPADVGEQIASYLVHGRPKSNSRFLFLRLKAPVTGITSKAISTEVKRVLAVSGIKAPNKGAHQFRHYLATEMLRHGASMAEIGEMLRHISPQTTEVYTKVDFVSLIALALPWPGGAK